MSLATDTLSSEAVPTMKVLLVGSSGVGKSSLMLRFSSDVFHEDLSTTIGVDFRTKLLHLDELAAAEGDTSALSTKVVRVQIWDTAGQERFRTLTSSYYRGAHAIVFVHDVTQPATREALLHWIAEADAHCAGREVTRMLISNKMDLLDNDTATRTTELECAAALARERKMLHFACSAKTSEGVAASFHELTLRAAESASFAATVARFNEGSAGSGGRAFVRNAVGDSLQRCAC